MITLLGRGEDMGELKLADMFALERVGWLGISKSSNKVYLVYVDVKNIIE